MSDTEKYINPFIDFGFKKIFGEEPNKDLLLDSLKEEQGQITGITYLKNESLGANQADRKAIFDLYCIDEGGERFIVELQRTAQKYFKDRLVYYATLPITEQAKQGDWNFELKAVYVIAILDFVFDEGKAAPTKYRYDAKLTEINDCQVFYNKLYFIYLEMPKFNKRLEELGSHFEQWMYVLKHLNKLERIPGALQERIFGRLFEVAELAKLPTEQAINYQESMKHYRDIKNSLDTAEKKGREEGIEKGREEGLKEGIEKGIQQEKLFIAQQMLQEGLDVRLIARLTGLNLQQIRQLKP